MAEQPLRVANEADFTLKLGSLTAEPLRVTAFEGSEGISQLYRFEIAFCSHQRELPLEDLLGQPALLEIVGNAGKRHVHGVALGLERTGEGANITHYAAEVGPLHWMLTKRHKSRIFEPARCPDMSVPGIITKVLQDAKIPSDQFRLALQGSYDPHEMIAQYRESDFAFISRLMEQEGIFYFFEHTPDGYCMVIADSPVAHLPNPDTPLLPFREPSGLEPHERRELIFALRERSRIQFGAVSLDDYDFRQPQKNLRSGVRSDRFTALEFSDYPGDFEDKNAGERYARIRLEESLSRRRILMLAGTARLLRPGFKFELIEHPADRFNREFLVTHVEHHASQPAAAEEEAATTPTLRHEVDLHVIPSDVPFRPPRKTTKPAVCGSHTAIVVGVPGEEIYTDKYGRVKVQFHWDQEGKFDENSSCWVRVSQGSAGGQYGMMFLPRVGQEVIVDFLEGDPDHPIITGRVYNADQMPPYALPDEKTKSVIKTHSTKGGGGTNEIRFEDRKDSEQILIYAQKDFHLHVNNDRVENIDKNRHLTVNENKFELVKQAKHSEVKLDQNEAIGGKMSLEVKGDVGEDFKGNHGEKVAGNYYLKAGSNVVVESGIAITLKVGGNFVKIDPSGVTIQGTLVKINSPGGVAGVGSPVQLAAPEAPATAEKVKPGKDVTYSGDPYTYDGVEAPENLTPPDDPERKPPLKTSWIEIEMVDESGQPWKRERYELKTPDGRIINGRLNDQGQARIRVKEPGQCMICFPDLDGRAWERL